MHRDGSYHIVYFESVQQWNTKYDDQSTNPTNKSS